MAKTYRPRPNRGPKADSQRRDVHAEVTNRIVEDLKKGVATWLCPWTTKGGAGLASGLPRNAISKRRYSGINIVLLWLTASERGYSSNEWLTFKQAKARGGSVKKGEKGTWVIFYKQITKQDRTEAGEIEENTVWLVREYYVFNVEQTEDVRLPGRPQAVRAPVTPGASIASQLDPAYLEAVAKTGADIRHGGHRAFYIPSQDYVQLPAIEDFKSGAHYQAVLAHELVHWTGGEKRLSRFEKGATSAKDYAFEELVAELGAAFTASEFGFAHAELRHADYIGSWLKLLQEDKKAVFRAASRASRAVAYLYPEAPAEEVDDEGEEVAEAA